ncbi:MAG: stage III sporulation protein AE [Oscillospiraceae bacterium]|nr:stage III sporulation protein AE [Oscillospiraceae bacterium]
MKKSLLLLCFLLLLSLPAQAVSLPKELEEAVDAEIMEGLSFQNENDLFAGICEIFERAKETSVALLRERFRGVAAVLLIAVICALAQSAAGGELAEQTTAMVGALAVTAVAAGDMTALLGVGVEKVRELSDFSSVLLPTLAAATAAGGAVGTASFHQVLTVFFADILLSLTETLLVPMVYLYVGIIAGEAVMRQGRMAGIAAGIKKAVSWIMTVMLTLFTAYLTVGGAVTGSADSLSIKMAKMAVSGAVPVVGGIISEAAAAALTGAGMLKNMIGIFGILAVLSLCLAPFLEIAVEYLLYKMASFAASMLGCHSLVTLIDGIGSAFGLVLGMVGSAAVLVMVSVVFSMMAVTV